MNTSLKLFLDAQIDNSDYHKQLMLQLYNDTDDNTVLQILARFHETLVESLQKIEQVLDDRENADSVWKIAHKIAGTAGLVGFASLGKTASDLSHQLRDKAATAESDENIRKFFNLTRTHKEMISNAFPNYRDYLL